MSNILPGDLQDLSVHHCLSVWKKLKSSSFCCAITAGIWHRPQDFVVNRYWNFWGPLREQWCICKELLYMMSDHYKIKTPWVRLMPDDISPRVVCIAQYPRLIHTLIAMTCDDGGRHVTMAAMNAMNARLYTSSATSAIYLVIGLSVTCHSMNWLQLRAECSTPGPARWR